METPLIQEIQRTKVASQAASFRATRARKNHDSAREEFDALLALFQSNPSDETETLVTAAAEHYEQSFDAWNEAQDASIAADLALEAAKKQLLAKREWDDLVALHPDRAQALKDKFRDLAVRERQDGKAEEENKEPHMLHVKAFLKQAEESFKDYGTLQEFPEPPASPCGKRVCAEGRGERALEACPCNIEEAFQGMELKELRRQKNRFHPAQFDAVPESVRMNSKAKAKEVYDVANRMYHARIVRLA